MSVLDFLLRPRRAPRRTRTFRPTVSGLEGRQLLSLSLVSTPSVFNIVPKQVAMKNDLIQASGNLAGLIASTNWGDGTPIQAGNIITPNYRQPGTYWVGGSHIYQKEGTYSIQVNVFNFLNGDKVSWTDTANVAAPPPPITFSIGEYTPIGIIDRDVVGAAAALYVNLDPPAKDAVIYQVNWKITGPDGVSPGLLEQTAPPGAQGYHVKPFGQSTDYEWLTPKTEITLLGYYWDALPGNHHVHADVEYNDGSGTRWYPADYDVTIKAPTGNLIPTESKSVRVIPLRNNPDGDYLISTSQDDTTAGIRIDASVDPDSVKNPDGTAVNLVGTYGVVQTFTSDNTRDYVIGGIEYRDRGLAQRWDQTGKVYTGPPLPTFVDYMPRAKTQFPYYVLQHPTTYQNLGAPVNIGEYKTASLFDTPDSGAQFGESMFRKDSYADYLMFTPDGGIPVPLGSPIKWSWGFSLTFPKDGTGEPDGITVPPSITAKYNPSGVPFFPKWQEQAMDFINPQTNEMVWLPISTKQADASIPAPDTVAQMPPKTSRFSDGRAIFDDQGEFVAWSDTPADATPVQVIPPDGVDPSQLSAEQLLALLDSYDQDQTSDPTLPA
jgi:hypothetical protein